MTTRRGVKARVSRFLSLLLVLMAACARDRGESHPEAAADHPSGRPAESSDFSGLALRIPVPSDPASLNPLLLRPRRALDYSSLLYPSLLVARPQGAHAPAVHGDLARWWEWDPTKHTLTCALRGGRLWEDTTRVSIADVVRSYDAYRALGWFAPHAAGDSLPDAGLASVQAVDDSTVRLTYRAGFSFWRAVSAATWPILPARKLNDLTVPMLQANAIGREPLSGGPFRVSDWRPGLNLWFAPHPFAGQNRRSPFNRVEFDVCPGIDARVLRLQMGRADVVLDVPVERLASWLDPSTEARLHHGGIESVEMLWWNLGSSGARPEIRSAVSLAVDRERIVRTLLSWRGETCGGVAGGLMEPAGPEADSLESETPVSADSIAARVDPTASGVDEEVATAAIPPRSVPSADDSLAAAPDTIEPVPVAPPTRYAPLPRFDRAAADALLDAAGWTERDAEGFRLLGGERLRVELLYDRDNLFREQLATLIESDLARVGIELVVQPVDGNAVEQRLRAGLFTAILTGFRPSAFPDPSPLWSTNGYWNGTGFASVVVDSLCRTIQQEEDAGRLHREARRLESILRRGGPVTFLVYREWTALIGPRVEGFVGRGDDPLRGLEELRPSETARER